MNITAPGPHRAAGVGSGGEAGAGQVIAGRYRVVRRIGAGAYGTVFEVEHTALGKHFALKLLNAQARQDKRTISRFEAEAVTASRIDHPNIVCVTDIGHTEQGHGFYVMELLEGRTLAQILRQGQLRVSRAIPILAAMSHAVGAAHAAGVIHRDLKPDNIFIVPQEDIQSGRTREVVRILDFGLAKVAESASFTIEGITYGTPAYMAPEQVQGRQVDGRADIYSLGCIAYEMFAGRPLFAGKALEVALAHCEQDPPPLLDAPSPRMRRVIECCLEKTPERRYQTCEALLDELRGIAVELMTPDGQTKQMQKPSTAEMEAAIAAEERTLSESGEWWEDFSDIASALEIASGQTDELLRVGRETDEQPTVEKRGLATLPVGGPPSMPGSRSSSIGRVGADSTPTLDTARTIQFRRQTPEETAPSKRSLPRVSVSSLAKIGSGQGAEEDADLLDPFTDESTIQVEHLPSPVTLERRGRGRWVVLVLMVGVLAAAAGAGVFFLVYRLTAAPATGGLMVQLQPATAELRIDGKLRLKAGPNRLIDELPAPGMVRLSLTHAGCRPLTRSVAVEKGRVKQLRLTLDCTGR